MQRVFPQDRIVVTTRSAAVSAAFTHPQADLLEGTYPTTRFWSTLPRLVQTVRSARMVVIGGGGLWQDVHSWSMPVAHLVPACLGLALGVPVCTVGLGVGPLRNRLVRAAIRFVAPGFAGLWVRDEESLKVLVDCGVPEARVHVAADVVPSLFDGPVEDGPRPPRGDRVCIILRRWRGLSVPGVSSLLDRLVADGLEPVLLAFEPDADRAFYGEVLAGCTPATRSRCRVPDLSTLDGTLAEIADARCAISMRLHGCVLAATLGVPFLAVSYDPKVDGFARQVGLPDSVVTLEEVDARLADRLPGLDAQARAIQPQVRSIVLASSHVFDEAAESALTRPGMRARIAGGLTLLPMLGIGALAAVRARLRTRRSV